MTDATFYTQMALPPMASTLMFPAMAMAIASLVIVFMQAAAGERELNMVLYMHENLTGSYQTAFPIAGLNGSSSDPTKFGTLAAHYNLITGSDADNIVGRAQGVYVNTNLVTETNFLMVMTVIFQDVEYNGSTLEMHGTDRAELPQREWAVVGGTGKFRFARGYVVVSTESIADMNTVIKLNITLHTECFSYLVPK